MKENTALDRAYRWLCGFGSRLLYALQVVGFIPLTVTLMLLAPLWWIVTGKTIPFPKWLERFHDGQMY
jgi:hypothetical protein